MEKKAKSLSANLRWRERGTKLPFMVKLLEQGLGSPCPYCRKELTLKNVSLDHKTPFENATARRDLETHYRLDVPENLQLVCRRCNKSKGDLSDVQYRKLLKFLSKDKHMEKSVLKKLSQSYHIYGKN